MEPGAGEPWAHFLDVEILISQHVFISPPFPLYQEHVWNLCHQVPVSPLLLLGCHIEENSERIQAIPQASEERLFSKYAQSTDSQVQSQDVV